MGGAFSGGQWWWLLATPMLGLATLGFYDLVQTKHSILRNYPIVGHLRFILESVRPEMQKYFIERGWMDDL